MQPWSHSRRLAATEPSLCDTDNNRMRRGITRRNALRNSIAVKVKQNAKKPTTRSWVAKNSGSFYKSAFKSTL